MKELNVVLARAIGTTILTLTLLAPAGCSTPREPSNLPTPNVVWPDGAATGAFADDPAAQAVQDFAIAWGVAWNAVDYSDPSYVESVGLFFAKRAAEQRAQDRTAGANNSSQLSNGPLPLLVLDVVHNGTTSTVVTCNRDLPPKDDHTWILYVQVTLSESGHYQLEFTQDDPFAESISDAYWDQCSSKVVPLGLFEPAPTTDPGAKVVFPADASKYDLD